MTHIGPDFQLRQTAIQSLLPVLLVLMSTSGSTLAVEPLLMRRDMQALLSPRVLMWAGAGVAAGALVHPWDNEVRFGLQEQPRLRDMLDVVDVYGSNRYASSGLVVTWGAARLIGHQPAAALSSGLVRSVVLANVLVTPLKFTVGRERPDGSNNRSFPSGHSANAFALTTALSRRLGPRLALPLYVATVAVPVSRVHRRRHYLSDVLAGSLLGIVAGRAVTGFERDAVSMRVVVGSAAGRPLPVLYWPLP